MKTTFCKLAYILAFVVVSFLGMNGHFNMTSAQENNKVASGMHNLPNYQLRASSIGASHTPHVVGTSDNYTLSGVAGQPLVGSGSNANYQLASGFWAQVAALRVQQQTGQTLAIYMISADNNPNSALSLNAYARGILASIEAATTANKRAVILVDFDQQGDTTIHVAHNGTSIPVVGLPDSSGILDTVINEYDMANGSQLGGFLRWALDTYATDTTQNILTYIGHGTFVMPDGDYPTQDQTRRMTVNMGVNPGFTDMHPQPSMIAPQDIRQMLDFGTSNGTIPLDVLDLTHCFAGTLEELYELINVNGDSYASIITASPSYGYVSETLFGDALAVLDSADNARVSAEKIVNSYNSTLARIEDGAVTHPALWTIVDPTLLLAIKPKLDTLASILNIRFNSNFADTRAKLQAAQRLAAVYDTSFAQADWTLDDTDSLVDVGSFMRALMQVFADDTALVGAANEVLSAVDAVTLQTVRRAGIPYFEPDAPIWFDTAEDGRVGLGLFAPFTAAIVDRDQHIAWQWLHYVGEEQQGYPNPYALLTGVGDGSATWATIVQRFWIGEDLEFSAYLPQLTPMQQVGDIFPIEILLPVPSTVHKSTPTPIAFTVHGDRALYGVQIHVEVSENGLPAFDEVITVAELQAGDNLIETRGFWTPTGGDYTIRISVDSSNRVLESDTGEDDNVIQTAGEVDSSFGLIITSTQTTQLFRTRTITFGIESNLPITSGLANLYKFDTNPDNPRVRAAEIVAKEVPFEIEKAVATLTLPEAIQIAGTFRVVVWGVSSDGISTNRQRVDLNYAPNAYTQQVAQTFYRVHVEATETLNFNVNVTNGALKWYLWSPSTPLTALKFNANESYQVPSAAVGEYIVMVEHTTSDPTYTLNVTRNGSPARASLSASDGEIVGLDRPVHVMRSIIVPGVDATPHSLFIPIIIR